MKTIHKYYLTASGRVELRMPLWSRVLTVQLQNGRPVLWALVDTGHAGYCTRVFNTYGTGQELPDNPGQYIGTYQDDEFVGHVFEVIV